MLEDLAVVRLAVKRRDKAGRTLRKVEQIVGDDMDRLALLHIEIESICNTDENEYLAETCFWKAFRHSEAIRRMWAKSLHELGLAFKKTGRREKAVQVVLDAIA